MNFLNWFINPVKHQYADFSGRATRKQFWMFQLVYVISYVILAIIGGIIGLGEWIAMLLTAAVIIPSVALTARRLHDVGKSGWWQLIGFIPLLGLIIMIVFLVMDSKEDNQYGPNPKNSMGGGVADPMPEVAPTMDAMPMASGEENQQRGM